MTLAKTRGRVVPRFATAPRGFQASCRLLLGGSDCRREESGINSIARLG